ncbi:TNF receptor-associated factor [Parasponia andersonii]|uniref:TNF receptor-associated factor n=1 Tax=Parasponia andersonii TaxID=3476 RepID=A0A2P5DHY3_PARAD|nr:TNF receptor-associated factor [Parasponia andersonii]
MELSAGNQEMYGRISNPRRFGIQIPESSFIRAPLTAFLEHTGIFGGGGGGSGSQETRGFVGNWHLQSRMARNSLQEEGDDDGNDDEDDLVGGGVEEDEEEEVSIRIIGAAEHQNEPVSVGGANVVQQNGSGNDNAGPSSARGGGEGNDESGTGATGNGRDSSYQRYDIQHFARWFEQILPFTLLLLIVFIRQHYQGFSVTIWIAAVMFKSNDIVRKQTALKGERKVPILVGISSVFMLHVICFYWWYRKDDLLYPLVLIPPKVVPPFWHAVFIIMINDIMVRQAAMALKCMLLVCYRDSRGRDYRKQGQMLNLIEYMLLLYRALLPTPVWYRFFLNKEYGSFFSSLTTGLYLTFKLTSVVEKVNAAGDLCAICQEKMHAPILLRCKHIFCEDCVSEWSFLSP